MSSHPSSRPARLLALGVLLGGCGGPSTPDGIVLITIDTCRADRLGCYGSEICETPVIDALAEEGAIFLDASAPVPVTLPSHASILTGLYPDRHTVRNNGDHRLPDAAVTLAEVLEDEGWSTGAFISAVPLERQFGTMQGFGTYDDDLLDSGGAESRRGILTYLFSHQRAADETVDHALDWIESQTGAGRRFLCWIHFFDPHHPYQAPTRFVGRYGASSYEAEVAFVDEQVGRLLEGLGRNRKNVLVALTADHGEALGEHGEETHGFFLYQETMHVPWILRGPGIPAGVRVGAPVSIVQIMPTLLDAVSLPVPEGLDGRSAMPLITGGVGAEADPVFGETLVPALRFGWAGLRSVRQGRWKYVEAPRPELYDLQGDPDELTNVADAHPDLVAEMRDELRQHTARGGALPTAEFTLDPETRERLAGLGYTGGRGGPEPGPEDPFHDSGDDPKDRIGVMRDLTAFQQSLLSGDDAASAKLLESLLETSSRNPVLLGLVYDAQAQARDWDGAARTARILAELTPDDPETWRSLAVAAESRSDWPVVVEALTHLTEALPDDARALVGLARATERIGTAEQAVPIWERAVSADPALPPAITGLASALARTGRDTRSIEVLRGGLERAPQNPDILNNLAWALANRPGQADEAYALAKRAASVSPDDPVILDTLGWAAIRSGHAAAAVEPLTEAWERTRDPEVRSHLGIALAESGDVESGRAHLEAAVQERASLRSVPEVQRWLVR